MVAKNLIEIYLIGLLAQEVPLANWLHGYTMREGSFNLNDFYLLVNFAETKAERMNSAMT